MEIIRQVEKEKTEKTRQKKNKEKWEIDFSYNLKTYFGFLKKYWLICVALLIIMLLFEVSYIVDKYLFKILIDNAGEFIKNSLTRDAFLNIIISVALVFSGLILFRVIFRWIRIHLTNVLDSGTMRDLKFWFFNHIVNLSHDFHTSHKTGSMITRILRGSGAMERLNDTVIFNMAPLIFTTIVACASMVSFDWISALVLFLTMVVFVSYSYIFQVLGKKPQAIFNEREDIEKANLSDFITNIDSVKYYGKEKDISLRYDNLAKKTKNSVMKFWGQFRWLESGQELILGIGTVLLIYFPLIGLLNGTITTGSLVFIYTIYMGLIGQVYGFVWGLRNYYHSMVDFESLFRYSKIEQSVKDKKDAKNLEIKDGEIEFKNVTFKYGKRTLFKNLNLKIEKNKKIALVGHSGCGKTSMIKLLYRFYDLESGKILIDGNDISEIKQESLRNEMSIVPQECVLFDDTIYNNVAFSKPSAKKEEVLEAMKFAQLDKIFRDFPLRENTVVGERGVRLSGGEKQRVSIARAILANKKILVLDEATSSLDSKTEYEIQNDLKKLMEGRTTIIIAHRLSTIMHADEIIVLERGKIVQAGSHLQLIRQPGCYKELWDLQKGGYIGQ